MIGASPSKNVLATQSYILDRQLSNDSLVMTVTLYHYTAQSSDANYSVHVMVHNSSKALVYVDYQQDYQLLTSPEHIYINVRDIDQYDGSHKMQITKDLVRGCSFGLYFDQMDQYGAIGIDMYVKWQNPLPFHRYHMVVKEAQKAHQNLIEFEVRAKMLYDQFEQLNLFVLRNAALRQQINAEQLLDSIDMDLFKLKGISCR